MSHPLQTRIGSLRARTRRVVALYGLSWMAAAGLAAALVVGLLDYLVRFEDPGIRLLASLGALGALGWTCYRRLCLPLGQRLRDVDLARRLEQRFPAEGGNLASAVEFLAQAEDDPTAGSVALRRAVIARATAQTEGLDFRAVVTPAPALRAALAAAAVGLVAMILVVLDPWACRTALARLAHPLGDVAWPKRTHLVLRERVERVARGQAFEVEVVDEFQAPLPSDLRIHYRFQTTDGSLAEEVEPMRLVGQAAVARRDNVTRPFWYFVRGGDDRSMQPIWVEVLEPPAIESLSIRLTPPPYSGFPVETADKNLRALVGTRVEITARANKPLRSAVLCWEGRGEVAARLSEDGFRLTVPAESAAPPLLIEKSGAYWFTLHDREGLSGGSETRWEIRAVADAAPTVTVEQPSANLFVTPAATVPLRVAAKDDLALAAIALAFRRSDRAEQPEEVLPLYTGPPHAGPRTAGFSVAAELGEHRLVERPWRLAELELRPGMHVDFRATATDYLPQTGKSDPRRLIIITPEELADRLAARQAVILAELARVLDLQRHSRQQVGDLEIQWRAAPGVNQLDLDRLRGAELHQRQVAQTLTSPSDGVPAHLDGLLADLKNNGIDRPDLERHVQALRAEIERLAREHLPVIGQELTAAVKTGQAALEDQTSAAASAPKGQRPTAMADPAVIASLAAAGAHQQRVMESLEQMLGQLARHESYRRVHRDLGELLRDQEELAGRTAALAKRTLTKELKDLLPQDLADLKIAAQHERELARRLDRVGQAMAQAIDQLRPSDPAAAQTAARALQRAQQSAIGAEMRSAAAALEANRMGQAMDGQRQVVRNLRDVLDILANRRDAELSGLEWQRLHEALRGLRQRQQAVLDQTRRLDAARQAQGRLSRQQAAAVLELASEETALRAEIDRFAQRLDRAEVLRLVLSLASADLAQAAELLQQRQTGAPAQEAEQGALARLEQLVAALEPAKAEPRPAAPEGGEGQPGSARLSPHALPELILLTLMQREVNRRTRELDEAYRPPENLTDDGRRHYAQLSAEQGRLAALVEQQAAGRLAGAPDPKTPHAREAPDAAATAEEENPLLDIALEMRQVEDLIAQAQSGAGTQQLQADIVARLEAIVKLAARQGGQPKPGEAQAADPAGRKPGDPSQHKPGAKPGQTAKPGKDSGQRQGGPEARSAGNVDEAIGVLRQHWGELPERARQRMIQLLPREEFLPKYELLIEQYYKRLAEEKR